jgi:hypothetical protein
MRPWYFCPPGSGNAYGPIEASSLEEARVKVRASLGVSRLPPGTDGWETSRQTIREIVDNNRRMAREIGQPPD